MNRRRIQYSREQPLVSGHLPPAIGMNGARRGLSGYLTPESDHDESTTLASTPSRIAVERGDTSDRRPSRFYPHRAGGSWPAPSRAGATRSAAGSRAEMA